MALSAMCLMAQLCAQDNRALDPLRLELAQARHDSLRVRTLLAMAAEWLGTEPDSAFDCCMRAKAIADRTGRAEDAAEVEGWLGYLEEQRGHIKEALAHYRTSLAIAEQLHDQAGISVVLNNLAAIYKDQGHIDSALAAHRRSLTIRQERHDTLGIATSLNNIGLILYDQGRIPEALEHYTDALHLYEALHDADGTATVLHNLAGIYSDQGDNDQALGYFLQALSLDSALDDAYSMASTEDNIGLVLERKGEMDKALQHYQEALRLHERADDVRGMGYSLRNIAGIELRRGDAAMALAHATQSLDRMSTSDDKRGQASALCMVGLALEASGRRREAIERGSEALILARELGYPLALRDAAQLLGRLYRSQQRWREALEMQDLYSTMRDSLHNEDARRSAIREQFKYAYEKKEAALKAEQRQQELLARERSQKEKNRRNILLLGSASLLLLAIGLLSRLRYMRRSRAAIQKERDVSDSLLHNILPDEVATELKQKGHADARHFDRATILFTDFKDFTSLAESLSPADLVEELNACFEAFDRIITTRGIEKIKTIGDAYMAAGGLPDPKTSSPTDVVLAALEMQAFMIARKNERDAQGLPGFEMRVGIHTGSVVAGIVGVKKFAYDIWGDTVNIASRMESSGEIGQVNISENTYSLVNHEKGLVFTARGKVQAKGKGAMEMYFVQRG